MRSILEVGSEQLPHFKFQKEKRYMKIKKVISACLVLTCLVTGLSGCGKTDRASDTAERPVITLGSDSYPPYNYLNEDGVPTGIDVELAREAFGRMGYDVEIVNIDWERKQLRFRLS